VKPLSDKQREKVEALIETVEDQLELVRSGLTRCDGKAAEAAVVEAHEKTTQLRLVVQDAVKDGGK
jgi:hypothetical protein